MMAFTRPDQTCLVLPVFVIQALFSLIVIITTGVAISQSQSELRRAQKIEYSGKAIYAPYIQDTGPANYPLTFTILVISIVVFVFSTVISALPDRRITRHTLIVQICYAIALTVPIVVGAIAFATLKGPPNRAYCGYGTSNLLDIGHNMCAHATTEVVWFVFGVLLAAITWITVGVITHSRRRAARAVNNVERVHKLSNEGNNNNNDNNAPMV